MVTRVLKWCVFVAILSCSKSLSRDLEDQEMHPDIKTPNTRSLNKALNDEEFVGEFWKSKAQAHIEEKMKQLVNNKKAKNIILFLGDGMSVHTVAATRDYIGNENLQLSFEKFPYVGLSKTYCVDAQVADSACTATAYLSGVKNNYGTIGVTADVRRYDCTAATDKTKHTTSIAKWAQDEKKATGIVTTARVTHASPAGMYAHTANRDWENDAAILKDGCRPSVNDDIAKQLVRWQVGKNLNVILGGGRREFLDKNMLDREGLPGYRNDGLHLIDEWLNSKKGNSSYIWSRDQLLHVDPINTNYLLGLFSSSHCPYHGDIKRNNREKRDPTLTEMTETAINILKQNENGFFLFVEAGRIDMAHHETRARKALEDTEEFSRAIQKARELTNVDDTLIVVTSDHSHTMTINGYPARGHDILGLSGNKGEDSLPYTSLSYANGRGYYNTYDRFGKRKDLSKDDFKNPEYEYMSTVPLDSETHAGEDVAVYAVGPKAHLFVGNYEQSNIPIIMAYAAEIGPFAKSGSFYVHGTYISIILSIVLVYFSR